MSTLDTGNSTPGKKQVMGRRSPKIDGKISTKFLKMCWTPYTKRDTLIILLDTIIYQSGFFTKVCI